MLRWLPDMPAPPYPSSAMSLGDIAAEGQRRSSEEHVKIEALKDAARKYLAHLHSEKPLDDDFRMMKSRIVTLACNLLSTEAAGGPMTTKAAPVRELYVQYGPPSAITSQPTPGPWEVVRHFHIDGELWLSVNQHADAHGMKEWVAEVKYLTTEPERQLANARLIAAAPDLLAALKLYVEHFRDPLKVARAAIAKAEHV